MSILTDLLHGRITFSQAATEVEDWITKIVNKDPVLANLISGVESYVKQAASNAIDIGETALKDILAPAVEAMEPALDAVLGKYLGPLAPGLVPATNDAIDRIVNAAVAEAQAWGLKAKAKLATSPPS